jgi:hypothetical protein
VRAPGLDGSQSLVRRSGRAGAVSFIFEDAGHEFTDVGFVVDDQDVGTHWRSP